MGKFLWPDWKPLPQDSPLPPPSPDPEQAIADNTRAEEALNQFIAARQNALFEAPDAFYRTQGSDAIHAAPVILDRLSKLRDAALDSLANDAQRDRLGSALDAHLQLARDGITRHVAEQSLAWQRKTAQDRIGLLTKEAAYHHNDEGLVDALGHAAANAARAHARVGDAPLDPAAEDAAAASARSGVLSAAIQARLDRGDAQRANDLLTLVNDQLDPAHAAALRGRMERDRARTTPPPADNMERAEPSFQGTVELAQAPNGSPAPTKPNSPTRPNIGAKPLSSAKDAKARAEEARQRRSDEARKELSLLVSEPLNPRVDTKEPLPDDWQSRLGDRMLDALDVAATRFGVPRLLLASILWQESEFGEKAGRGSRNQGQGIAAVSADAKAELLRRAKNRGDRYRQNELQSFDRMNGPDAVSMAAEYLRMIYDENHHSWPAAVAGYKSSPPKVFGWLNGTGTMLRQDPLEWPRLGAYLRQVFRGNPARFD